MTALPRFSFAAALLLASSSLLTACGGEQEFDDANDSSFDDSAREAPADDHTLSCETNADCPDGYVCQGEHCCPNVDLDIPGGEPPPELPPPVSKNPEQSETCSYGNLSYASETPTVMVVVDQSLSMDEKLNGGEKRWSAIRSALTDEQNSVIKMLQHEVSFGLALYSWDGKDPEQCPMMSNVSVGLGNFEAIANHFNAASLIKHTPTAEALDRVTETLLELDSDRPKAIILATDGDPDHCGDADSNGESFPRELSIEAIQTASSYGIETYVIDVGPEDTHLQQLADAGAGLDPSGDERATLYRPDSGADLHGDIEEIVWGVRACTIQLDNPVSEDQLAGAEVTVDGEIVSMDAKNGWRLNGDHEVQLMGEACEMVSTGDHHVEAAFPCITEEVAN